MIIHLQEIPLEGRTWTFDRKTAQLNESLRPLIKNQEYTAELVVTPLNSDSGSYEARGFIKTQLSEECSRCGLDYNHQVNEKFLNILMPALETPRDAKFAKPNHFTDLHESGPDVVEYEGVSFNVGDFFYEIVAIAEPTIPAPPADEKGNCGICKISLKDRTFSYDSGTIEPVHPFAGLKGIKLN